MIWFYGVSTIVGHLMLNSVYIRYIRFVNISQQSSIVPDIAMYHE